MASRVSKSRYTTPDGWYTHVHNSLHGYCSILDTRVSHGICREQILLYGRATYITNARVTMSLAYVKRALHGQCDPSVKQKKSPCGAISGVFMELTYLNNTNAICDTLDLTNKEGTAMDNTTDWKDTTDRIRTTDPEGGPKDLDHSATVTLVLRGLKLAVYKSNIAFTGDVSHP